MKRESQKRKTFQRKGSNKITTSNLLENTTIQNIFQQYKLNNSTYEGTKKIFQIFQLSNGLTKDPQNPIIKENLQQKIEITQQMILRSKQQSTNQFVNYRFDINKMLMTNKLGSFGTIEKKCKFTQKGVLQYENEKSQPKLKEIIGFHSIVEMLVSKVRHSKLPWLKQPSGNLYRIVLIDKNKAQKGIYFKSLEQAYSARVYLIQKYKNKIKSERIKQIFMNSNHVLNHKISQNFVQKLLHWNKYQDQEKRKSLKDNKSIHQKSQQSSNKQIKLFDNLNKSSKEIQNQKGKFDESMFDIDRDSHPLSHFYFGQKKQYSTKNIYVQDSKTQIGFKKTPNKIKEMQKIQENKRNFLPYGFDQKMKRFNKTNIQDFIEKWRQTVQQKTMKKNQNRQITDDTQLFYILNAVTENEVKKGSKRLKEKQKNMLVFENLRLNLGTNTQIPFKLELQVQICSLRGYSKQLVYTTFKSINEQSEGNLVYDLVEKNLNQLDSIDKKIQLQGGIDRYKVSLRLKQRISEDLLAQNEIYLKDIRLFGGKFNIQILSKQKNIEGNNNENMYGLLSCSISGRLFNQQNNKNDQNKVQDNQLMNNNNNIGLFSKILPLISIGKFEENVNNEDQQTYFRKLFTNLPLLEQNIKANIESLLLKEEKNAGINIRSIFCHVPIDQLSSLIPTEEEYQLLAISYTVLDRVNMLDKVKQCSMHLLILRHMKMSELFRTRQQLIESFLSILINWSQQFLHTIPRHHQYHHFISLSKTIGLDEPINTIQQKLSLQRVITQHLLQKQCPSIVNRCKQTNIPIVLMLIDYCNMLMVKNLPSKLWIILIINIFSNRISSVPIQIGLILIAVYICKLFIDDIQNCNTIDDIKQLLQTSIYSNLQLNYNFNHCLNLTSSIQTFINTKYQQHFLSQSTSHELQQLKTLFYTLQSINLQQKNKHRYAQKTQIINSLPNINLNPQLFNTIINNNKLPNKKCLHLYFVTLPNISGSLYLRTSSTQFQCTQYEKNPYFIIPDIQSNIKVEFIDSKSNQYSFQLKMDIGFGLFTQEVKNTKTSNIIVFQYWAGLLDQEIIINQSFTNSKQLQQSLSSFLTIQTIKQRLMKQPTQSLIYQQLQTQLLTSNITTNQSGQQVLRRIKIAFSQNNKINQYQLFLYLVINRKVSLKQKIYSVFQYADFIVLQLCLMRKNDFMRRVMLYGMFKLMNVNVSKQQFQGLYQGMMFEWSQCYVPKVLKATFSSIIVQNVSIIVQKVSIIAQNILVNLQQEVYQYLQQRSSKYIYYDIDVEQLLIYLQPIIIDKLQLQTKKINLTQGILKLIVSSQGKVIPHQFKILIKNNNRQFYINQQSLPHYQYQSQLQTIKPKLLKMKGSSSSSTRQYENLDTTFSPVKKQTFKVFQQQPNSASRKILINSPTKKSQLTQINMQTQSRFKDQSNIKINNQTQSRFKDQSNIKQKSQLIIQIQTKSQHNQSLEELNLIKYVLKRAKRIIPLRYHHNCQGKVMFRQFQLFQHINTYIYGINSKNHQLSSIKEVYYNNTRVNNLSFLNSSHYVLHFHTDLNNQLVQYNPYIGLQNNLRRFFYTKDTQPTKIYFISTNIKSQKYFHSNQIQAKIMIDYNNGIIRWQKCKVMGQFLMKRQKPKKKDKKMYLIILDGKQKIIQEKYIKISQNNNNSQIKNLGQITQKNKQRWQQYML